MKILKIPVWWTTKEAEDILLFLDGLSNAIGQVYSEPIQQMHRAQQQEQNERAQENDGNNEIPF